MSTLGTPVGITPELIRNMQGITPEHLRTMTTQPTPAPTPRTDAMLNGCEWGNRQDQEHTILCRTLERELTSAQAALAAKDAEIAELTDQLRIVVDAESFRARKIERDRDTLRAEVERLKVAQRERTQWKCACGGTDCDGRANAGTAEANARLICAAPEMAEALAWYGEQARLARLVHSGGDEGRNAIASDGGNKARALLARINGGNP